MIPEPQRTYVLELLNELGPLADEFVVVGAQAMKFIFENARGTKDIDFVLDVVGLRGEKADIAQKLEQLGYKVVPGSRNFQFEKPIPGSAQSMRIEFMAPDELKREKDFRVDVDKQIHARACTGGTIALAESDVHRISGKLPDGTPVTASIRVTKPHALVMLKLLALDERYRNIRGAREAEHDREEARTHAADIIAIVKAQVDLKGEFRSNFTRQFQSNDELGRRVIKISKEYFAEATSPGLLVYAEFLAANRPAGRESQREIAYETEKAQVLMSELIDDSEKQNTE